MKFIITLFILGCSFNKAISQSIQLINEDAVIADSLVLFNHHANHFTLSGDPNLHHYGLTLKNGVVTYVGSGRYLVRNQSKAPVEISVFRQDEASDSQQVLFTRIYHVQDIGECRAVLIQEKNETLSNGQVINQTRLEPVFSNRNYKGFSSIAHFELSAVQPDQRKLFSNQFISGKFLGIEISKQLSHLKKGGRLFFTQVVMLTQDGSYQRLADFSVNYEKAD